MQGAYCGECEWQYRVDGDDPEELSRAMVDHFVETGHSPVERCDAEERLSADEQDDPSSETPEGSLEPSQKKEQ